MYLRKLFRLAVAVVLAITASISSISPSRANEIRNYKTLTDFFSLAGWGIGNMPAFQFLGYLFVSISQLVVQPSLDRKSVV